MPDLVSGRKVEAGPISQSGSKRKWIDFNVAKLFFTNFLPLN